MKAKLVSNSQLLLFFTSKLTIASPHVGVQHEPLPASALVISSDASRDTDLFASPVPDLAHVCS